MLRAYHTKHTIFNLGPPYLVSIRYGTGFKRTPMSCHLERLTAAGIDNIPALISVGTQNVTLRQSIAVQGCNTPLYTRRASKAESQAVESLGGHIRFCVCSERPTGSQSQAGLALRLVSVVIVCCKFELQFVASLTFVDLTRLQCASCVGRIP